MSLDLFLLKGTAPKIDKNKKYDYDELMKMGYDLFDDDCIDDIAVEDIKKIAIPCIVKYRRFNHEKIQKEYNLNELPEVCGFGKDGYTFFGDNDIFDILDDDVEKFIEEAEKICWVVRLERICVWKNDEDLAEFINSLIKNKEVENCGCYHIPKEALVELDEYTSYMYDFSQYENDMIFYREWY